MTPNIAYAADPAQPVMNVTPAEIERLLALEHADPHSILGAHPTLEGIVVRSYRPEAESVSLLLEGDAPRPMARIDPRGLFEVTVPDAAKWPPIASR